MHRNTLTRFLLCGLLLLAACTSHQQSAPDFTVRVCWLRDPESLNPVTQPNTQAVHAVSLLYQSLLAPDGPTRRYVPCLAAELPRVERRDSLTLLHYRLHPQATWDNGEPITAQDVAFTLKVLNCPNLPNEGQRSLVSFIRDIRPNASDPRSFTLICQGYTPEYLISSGDFPILPEYLLDQQKQLRAVPLTLLQANDSTVANLAPVRAFIKAYNQPERWHTPQVLRGSGPYQLESWQAGQRLVLKRKTHWWADALQTTSPALRANPTRLEFHIVPNPATAMLALQRGELDVDAFLNGNDFERLHQQDSTGFRFYAEPSYRVVTLELNTRQPTLQDAATRRALAHLLDVPSLLQATQQGRGQATTGLISPRERWVYHDSLPLRRFDPNQTAQLLHSAGWQADAKGWHRAGQTLQPRLFYSAEDRTFTTIALQFQQAAKQIGLTVSLHPTEASQLSVLRRTGQFDLSIRMLRGNPFAYDLRPLLHTSSIGEGGSNRTFFGTPASDALLASIAATADSARKAHQLHRLQTLLYTEAPLLPIFFEPMRVAVSKRFRNVRPSGIEPGYDLGAFELAASPATR